MTDQQLQTLLAQLLDAAERQTVREVKAELVEAMNACAILPREHRAEVRTLVAEATANIAPAGAGMLGIWLGSSVEGGVAPEPTATALMSTFLPVSYTHLPLPTISSV